MAAQKILIGIVLVAMISTCIKGEREAWSCTNSSAQIYCPWNHHIRIQSAVYGRTRLDICPYEPVTTNCEPQDVTHHIRYDCDYTFHCKVVIDEKILFSDTIDPCVGYNKYLHVKWTCETQPEEEPFEQIACTGSRTAVRCGAGLIRIQSAVYGRTSMDECPAERSTTNCEPRDVSHHIRYDCEFKRSCAVETSYYYRFSVDTSDPCSGYEKYVHVKWTCETRGIHQTFGCPGAVPTPVRCAEHDGVIRIQSAVYGRTEMDVCPSDRSTTDCEPQDVSQYIRNKCDDLTDCLVDHSFGTIDPCSGYSKYVDVKWTCEPQQTFQKFACRTTRTDLQCATGRIRIQSAVYGRTDMSVCPYHKSRIPCEPQDVSPFISYDCDAQKTCTVETRYEERLSRLTRDPCPGFNKYVDVKWTCDSTHTYTIATRTYGYSIHGTKWASSDASVKIRLHGTKGTSGFHSDLDTPADDMEAWKVDVFNDIRVFDVGDLTKIDVMVWRVDDKWGCKWIAVRDDERQKAWLFETGEEATFDYHEGRSLVNPTPISQGDFSKYFVPRSDHKPRPK